MPFEVAVAGQAAGAKWSASCNPCLMVLPPHGFGLSSKILGEAI